MFDVTALGELLIDFTLVGTDENGYPAMKAAPGGAPCNFLAALAEYGCKAAFIGSVGCDAFGDMLVGTLKQRWIETRGVVRSVDSFTTLAFVTLGKNGEREFSFARKPGADTRLSFSDIDKTLIDDSRVFHFGTLSLTDEPARGATEKAVAYARSGGKIISCDPNLRLPLWKSKSAAKDAMLRALSQSDVVKISGDEIEFLFDCSPHEGAEKVLALGAKLVFVTLGANGCLFSNGNGSGEIKAPTGIRAVDTTGAGDVFGGAAMSRLLKSGSLPNALSVSDMRGIARFACCAASLSTESCGGINSVVPEEKVLGAIKRLY